MGEFIDELRELLDMSFRDWIVETIEENAYLVFVLVYSVVRATGVTVQSGTTGLLFSFGRARKVVPPGFRMLIPFLQVVRTVPSRQRTMDLPSQRVTTFDGLVYLVDANLVYRIVDIRKALIEIDDLLRGMRQVLVLSVQEVLRASERASFRTSEDLDRRLTEAMARRLVAWGVEVEHAGFTSITPSPKTLRLTQLSQRVGERRRNLERLERAVPPVPRPMGLALLGTSQRVLTRSRLGREREILARRKKRVERMYRRARVALAGLGLERRVQNRLRRELLADAGLSGVLGDAGFGDDGPPRRAEEAEKAVKQVKVRVRSSPRSNPTRVRKSPTGRKPGTPR